MGRERTPNASPQGAQFGAPTADAGDELQQAHAAVELVEGMGPGPSVAAMAEQAIERRAYASAMNVARIWLLNKPHVERAARSMDPADSFVARAQAVLDRMRPLEAKLPSHPFALGVPELDRKDRDAWLAQIGAAAPASGTFSADAGIGTGHGEGTTRDAIDLEDIARGILVPAWAQNDTVRRTVFGADQNPVMDGVDDVAHSLIYDSVYGAGFAVGAAHGCGHAVVDCLRGPYDLAKLAVEVGTKLALYQHTELLTSLRDTIKAVPAAIDLLGKRWNDDSDRLAQGTFQGEVVGYIGTQLAILVITAAVDPLAELAGPYAAVIRAIAAVGDPLTAVRELALGVRLSEEATAALRLVRRGANASPEVTTVTGGRHGTFGGDESLMDLLTDPEPTPEVRQVQQEALRRHGNAPNRQLDLAFDALDALRQGVRARRATEIPAVTRALREAGLSHVTPEGISELHSYLFESAGIMFSYENYAAWNRLTRGLGTVDDIRFAIHELAEIRSLNNTGIDFMGNGLVIDTQRHTDWYDNTFHPNYTAAHSEALQAEYKFIAEQINEACEVSRPITPEEAAAFDPIRDEGRDHMLIDGKSLVANQNFPRWQARGHELVTISPSMQAKFGVGAEISLSALLVSIKRQPASALTR